jgi:DNA repair exonuclease SbcCD ATPase subunit
VAIDTSQFEASASSLEARAKEAMATGSISMMAKADGMREVLPAYRQAIRAIDTLQADNAKLRARCEDAEKTITELGFNRAQETIAKLRELSETLKLEAQQHAQEARTANATIAEIYAVCSGATGEPGNWHGAEPVRQCVAKLRAEVEGLRKHAQALIQAS